MTITSQKQQTSNNVNLQKRNSRVKKHRHQVISFNLLGGQYRKRILNYNVFAGTFNIKGSVFNDVRVERQGYRVGVTPATGYWEKKWASSVFLRLVKTKSKRAPHTDLKKMNAQFLTLGGFPERRR